MVNELKKWGLGLATVGIIAALLAIMLFLANLAMRYELTPIGGLVLGGIFVLVLARLIGGTFATR